MAREENIFHYGQDRLNAGSALHLGWGRLRGKIGAEASARVDAAHETVRKIAEGKDSVYGINTGFGPLCTTRISAEDTRKLQYNILRSHSSGMGPAISNEIARLMMVLKVHALAMGHSGVPYATLERIIWHIENNAVPVVPVYGSVGASGDLAPLSHLFLPLIGHGEVTWQGERMPAREMLKRAGLSPLELGPKEGLALINGTQFITAHAVVGLERFLNCLDHADIAGAMSLEALLGSESPFSEEVHRLRPYRGSLYVARRLRGLIRGSEMLTSHAHCGRVQDPYSLRCMPQVHGASRNAWLHLKEILDVELNAVTDNPLVFPPDSAVSGGNFHGQPLAMPLDYASLAASELGNISDRRSYLLLEGGYDGLPKLLVRESGLNSGFMIPQYTSAALTSENKSLCFPASADSIPTSLGQEDHVSMGSISARKFNTILENLERILSVELLLAAQGMDFRRPMKSGPVMEACHGRIREIVTHAEEDREFGLDLEAIHDLVRSRELPEIAREAAGTAGFELNGSDSRDFQIGIH